MYCYSWIQKLLVICNFISNTLGNSIWGVGVLTKEHIYTLVLGGNCWCWIVNVLVPCLSSLQAISLIFRLTALHLFWYCELMIFVGTCNCYAHFLAVKKWRGLPAGYLLSQLLFLPFVGCNYIAIWRSRTLQLKIVPMKSVHKTGPSFHDIGPSLCCLLSP